MKKYQVTINFDWEEEYMNLIPKHRNFVTKMIDMGVIEYYAVTMESLRIWITINAKDKAEIKKYLSESPLFPYWTYEADELFVLDGTYYRLPALQLN